MAHKYPLMRPLLLLKSKVEVQDNKINVYMKIKGADFLKAIQKQQEKENERQEKEQAHMMKGVNPNSMMSSINRNMPNMSMPKINVPKF